ncbi:hypothetical protein [Tateyamaria omphalii]|uniref:Rieske domain-containing protein n=1 Tax=Tateyamaria omphalii TaxID=299262 RepID=A0A1P8MXU4_9RHOB|nr:hypothetical protein [Tateyamaria omphalii]APX12900.1 hypothetical protein BWR18_15320 [Tateyamaria omphalii]
MHKLTRRHVIARLTGATTALFCPAILNAQTNLARDWGDIPTDQPIGEDRLIEVAPGLAEIDLTELRPGEIAVIARPTDDPEYSETGMTQYVAVHHRTEDQIAFGEANDREGTVQDPRYFVVNLLCTHRGSAVGLTGDPLAPFACTDQRERHASVFDVTGMGVAGASQDEYLSVPDHMVTETAAGIILELA